VAELDLDALENDDADWTYGDLETQKRWLIAELRACRAERDNSCPWCDDEGPGVRYTAAIARAGRAEVDFTTLRRSYDALRADRDGIEAGAKEILRQHIAAEGRVAAALEGHNPSQGMCETCGTDHPCRTRRILLGGAP
jgi:hypothetical protein